MRSRQKKINKLVRRDHADTYLLTSLVAFAATVIGVREFLQLTGFPQIGNSMLHIAHALWGGLLLFMAVLLPLTLANRWAIRASALLSGVGIGLFIDEVGKFITQTNDYFFPPALSIIYGFFLLTAIVYLYFRQPRREDARAAMYHALDSLQDVLDGDLDTDEASRISRLLDSAKDSDRRELASLASVLSGYLHKEVGNLAASNSNYWSRLVKWVDVAGMQVGRRIHRAIIAGLLIIWLVVVFGYVVVLSQGGDTLSSQLLQWRNPLLVIQVLIGGLMILGLFFWFMGNENRGLNFAIGGFLLSLVALQTLYFYLSQFSAITSTLLQVSILLVFFAYRRWYLTEYPAT